MLNVNNSRPMEPAKIKPAIYRLCASLLQMLGINTIQVIEAVVRARRAGCHGVHPKPTGNRQMPPATAAPVAGESENINADMQMSRICSVPRDCPAISQVPTAAR